MSAAVSDALLCLFRPDHDRGHFPSTIVMPNGSQACATDYELCGILAREVVALWPS